MTAQVVLITKRCSTCLEEKPASEFHKNKNTNDGLYSRCKACAIASAKESAARRRAEMGEEAWLEQSRRYVAESRARRGHDYDRRYNRARDAAVKSLIAAHRREFDALLEREKYEAGLV